MDFATDLKHTLASSEFKAFKSYWTTQFRPTINKHNRNRHRALVVGAGINGLTTALRLALDGFKVKVVAKEFVPKDPMAPGYVSTVAGALWEYPPAVCGRHRDEVSISRSKVWSVETYNFLHGLSKLPGGHGVGMHKTNFYFRFHIEDREEELEKMQAYAKVCAGFKRGLDIVDRKLISAEEADDIKDAYQCLCPVIETTQYLQWLHLLAIDMGIQIKQGDVPAPLKAHEQEIKDDYNVDIIVNCSGIGSLELVPDPDVYPLRGALCRVWNDGRDFPIVNQVHAIGHDQFAVDADGKSKQDIIFIVPRGKVLLLGGIAEEDNWDLSVTLQNYKPYREMMDRCVNFMPQLRNATLIKEEPLRVGLRPGHTTGVKNYVQQGTSIVHSYGHGGSGFSFSIGSANEVLLRSRTLINSKRQQPIIASMI